MKDKEAAFDFIKQVTEEPRDHAFIAPDYYHGFMHGVTAFMIYGSECEEGDDVGEFLMRKWLNVKDERK